MSTRDKIRILHLLPSLELGGAEMMLYKLISHMDSTEFKNSVVAMSDSGIIGERLTAMGIEVSSLGMSRNLPNPLALFRLRKIFQQFRPSVIQTWMYHADLVGGLLAKYFGHKSPV